MAADLAADSDAILGRFNRLIRELMRGEVSRNTFQLWEIELLLNIKSCPMRQSDRENILRRYQKAVQRQVEKDTTMPMKLSEFLGRRAR